MHRRVHYNRLERSFMRRSGQSLRQHVHFSGQIHRQAAAWFRVNTSRQVIPSRGRCPFYWDQRCNAKKRVNWQSWRHRLWSGRGAAEANSQITARTKNGYFQGRCSVMTFNSSYYIVFLAYPENLYRHIADRPSNRHCTMTGKTWCPSRVYV